MNYVRIVIRLIKNKLQKKNLIFCGRKEQLEKSNTSLKIVKLTWGIS